MGVVIRMNSKTFTKDFLPENNPEDFVYVLASQNITTEGANKNVLAMPKLIPPVEVMRLLLDGDKDTYQKAVLRFLKHPYIEPWVYTFVKAAVIDDMNVVILCSKSEDDFGYLKLICEFVEEVYGLKTYTYKKFKENPEKAKTIKNIDEVKEVLDKVYANMESNGISFDADPDKEKKTIEELKKMKGKELRKLAKKYNIDFDEDTSKKKLIKKIAKKTA